MAQGGEPPPWPWPNMGGGVAVSSNMGGGSIACLSVWSRHCTGEPRLVASPGGAGGGDGRGSTLPVFSAPPRRHTLSHVRSPCEQGANPPPPTPGGHMPACMSAMRARTSNTPCIR